MSTVYVPFGGIGKGYAVLDGPADGNTVVTLESQDTDIVTVPANVTVLDGEFIGEFDITWISGGSTQVRMTLDNNIVDLDVEAEAGEVAQGVRVV